VDILERLRAALTGRYAIERQLGEGGMATVYLAGDLRHDRKVAVKVLRAELAAVIGADRFVQEIKTTASLQHPHILPLFDSGEADSFLYYVMPYVEGETLRDRLHRETQLPVEEAVEIAQAVASALDYAHRRGVIHRDIKPENVLLQDGQALVADFGIALAVSHAGGSRLTETGLSLGTPHYMSPEQATAEREIDGRSDVYALGCVLYEMLVGEPPHTGPTAQAIIAKIITEDPQPPSVRRPMVPPNVDGAVRKALAKLPADRFATAADFSRALGDASYAAPTSARTAPVTGRNRWKLAAIAAAAVAIAASIAAIGLATRGAPAAPTHRVSVALPKGQELRNPYVGTTLTVSADGEVFAYLGPDAGPTWQIWVRRRDELEATPVPGTTTATDPALTPDGSEVAFSTGGPGPIKVVSLATGAVRTVVDSAQWRGLTWGDDGSLYFIAANKGLARVSPDGGHVTALTSPAAGTIHGYPDVLPGSRGAVFIIGTSGTAASWKIAAVDFASGAFRELGPGSSPLYLPTGDLAWTTPSGDVMAAPFDVHRLELTGPTVRLLQNVSIGTWGTAHMAVSKSGTLLYQRGDIASRATPVWVTRDGAAEPVARGWEFPVLTGNMGMALSPDGARLVLPILGPTGVDLWARDRSGILSRLTFDGSNARPAWRPDGQAIAFLSNRLKPARDVWMKRADGSGTAQLLLTSDRQIDEISFSHDGQWLVYRLGTGADRDVYGIRPGRDSVGTPLLATQYEERAATLSPDDHWMAYVSNETGRDEVYVCPFPEASASKWQVSTDGGTEPVWERDGRELFYRNGNDDLVAVEVTAATTFAVGSKRVLFSARPYYPDVNHANYDVDRGGRRFLMLRIDSTSGGELILVDHWFADVTAMMRSR
jgi:predicted RNase H-related nuclease YkuK (DUF458 family)